MVGLRGPVVFMTNNPIYIYIWNMDKPDISIKRDVYKYFITLTRLNMLCLLDIYS